MRSLKKHVQKVVGQNCRCKKCDLHNTEPRILRDPILSKIPSCAVTYWEHRSENSTILILVESNPSKGFTKFENLNLNFQRFFRYITAFSNFQILKTVFFEQQRGIARISRHQRQRQPTQAMTIAATTTTATAAPTRAQWWSHQGSTGGERTASSSRDDSSGSTTYQYS